MRSQQSLLFLGLTLLCAAVASAQSFTFIPQDTVLSGNLGGEIVFNCTVTNTSTGTLTLAFVRTVNQLPRAWSSSLCLAVCFAPSVDSIATTTAFGDSALSPGSSRAFSVHVYPDSNLGTGIIRILAKNVRNQADQRILTFTARAPLTGVKPLPERALQFALAQNYPNPFNPSTTIRLQISGTGHVSLRVFDVLGKEVTTLMNEERSAGIHTVRFDATAIPSGFYFYRLTCGGLTQTRSLVVVK